MDNRNGKQVDELQDNHLAEVEMEDEHQGCINDDKNNSYLDPYGRENIVYWLHRLMLSFETYYIFTCNPISSQHLIRAWAREAQSTPRPPSQDDDKSEENSITAGDM